MIQECQKRGQIPAQIFIYVIAILIFSLIILFGYKSIKSSQERASDVALIQFKTQLKQDIKSVGSDYGSAKREEYKLPSGFDEVCFVDLEKVDRFFVEDPVILDSVDTGVQKNTFLVGKNNFESLYTKGLQLPKPYFYCTPKKVGNFKLTIKGMGDGAVVKTKVSKEVCENAENEVATNVTLCDGLDITFEPGYKSECCAEYGLCC